MYIEKIDYGRVTETYISEMLQNKKYCDEFIY